MTVHPVFYCGCGPCKWACDNGNHRDNCPHDKSSEMVSLRESLRASNAALTASLAAEREKVAALLREPEHRGLMDLVDDVKRLTASNAALKQEVALATGNMAALQSELAAFKNWQPSDPGTKEAMEWVTKYGHHEYPVGEERAFLNEAAKRLAPSLSAAMVRLEEAEKVIEAARQMDYPQNPATTDLPHPSKAGKGAV